MCKVIAISNQKGGVGKTTTTVNLGIGLARQGKKVLVIDADPQGSLTASLGYVEPDEIGVTLATIMTAVINGEEIDLTDGILHHKENIDLLPSNIELSALEVMMGNVMSRELIMKDYIEAVRNEYDYILIDCMPSLGMMTINALVAADSVLIPVQAAYLPVKGLQQLIRTIAMVKKRLNRKLVFEGILLTMVDFRTNYARDVAGKVRESYGDKIEIFDTAIALLAGMMVVPAVYIFSGEAGTQASGAGLMFVTLPKVFGQMAAGRIIGVLFFALVFFAALTSSVSVMEAITSMIMDRLGISRLKACIGIIVFSVLLGIPCSLGNGVWAHVTILGMDFLTFCDFISNSLLLPVVAFLTCILIGWFAKPDYVINEATKNGETFKRKLIYRVMVKYIAPVLLLIILVFYTLAQFGVISY
mgnify:CR=1 FL=1